MKKLISLLSAFTLLLSTFALGEEAALNPTELGPYTITAGDNFNFTMTEPLAVTLEHTSLPVIAGLEFHDYAEFGLSVDALLAVGLTFRPRPTALHRPLVRLQL